MARFDHIILTAANDAQAEGYRCQIAWRRRCGLLDPDVPVDVISDPGNRRVGSLGATLNVLTILATRYARTVTQGRGLSLAGLFAGRRILVCHSGGDSRRTPAYAAHGKLFTPLPTMLNGNPVALFDLLLRNMEKLPAPAGGQVLVISGDVLLTFDPQIVDFGNSGVTGVAYPGPMNRGARHGVYVAAGGQGCVPVRDFLQKPDHARAVERQALDSEGRVLIDTGLLSFDPPATARLLGAAGVVWRRGKVILQGSSLVAAITAGTMPVMDLYEELVMALAPACDWSTYLAQVRARYSPAATMRRLKSFREATRCLQFNVNILPWCDFFHIGSSRELLANITALSRTAAELNFTNGSNSFMAPGVVVEGAFVYDSMVTTSRVQAANSLLEGVNLVSPIILGGRNIVTGLPPIKGCPIRLPADLGLVILPVGDREWTAIVYGLDDDFKAIVDAAPPATFLNRSLSGWLAECEIAPGRVWCTGERRDLWTARLWLVGSLRTVLRRAVAMTGRQKAIKVRGGEALRSMVELMPCINHTRLLANTEEIRRRVFLYTVIERLSADDHLTSHSVLATITTRAEGVAVVERLGSFLAGACPVRLRARILRLAAMIGGRFNLPSPVLRRLGCAAPAELMQACFKAVSEAVARQVALPNRPVPAAILPDQVVWVTTPVRIDFAGGWSDTPPICTDIGGAVVNAAVTLNGQYPVQVMAKLNGDHRLRLTSIDLGAKVEICTTDELLAHADPRHWASLPKAALTLAGFGPRDPSTRLDRWLAKVGGGLDLTIFSALPKGSGLGTSSILGAAVIACLRRVQGLPYQSEQIIALTSVLEQRMSTGGGWQDQVGGITPGVKLIATAPGGDQSVGIQWIPFERAAETPWRDRLLLYYTGQKRMARNILRNVVGCYLEREPRTIAAIADLKSNALQMKQVLDARDFEGFAAGIREYWRIKQGIDPDSTNPRIAALIGRIARWTSACTLTGAGGGGFLLIVARDGGAARIIRRTLTAHPPNQHARFFDFDIDQQGLRVTVL